MYISIHRRIRRLRPSAKRETCFAGRALPRIPRLLALAMLLAFPVGAQSPGLPGLPRPLFNEPSTAPNDSMDAHRIEQLNIMRQKALVSDADKLLQLARELNDDASAGGTKLSLLEKMHKAGEIEKLAKNVKDKMTYTIGDPTQIVPFPSTQR